MVERQKLVRAKKQSKSKEDSMYKKGMKGDPLYFINADTGAIEWVVDRTVNVLIPQDKSIGPISTCVAVVNT